MTERHRKHLSPHFTLYEFTRSGVAIDNSIDNFPPAAERAALTALCDHVLEPLRARFGPIVVSSGYRCRRVNALAGGVPSSQHVKGEAADIVASSPELLRAYFRFVRGNLDFDQLILEPAGSPTPRWLHVSYTARRANRRKVVEG